MRRAAGEVLGWQGLVQARAVSGRMRIRVEDRQPGERFFVEGHEPADPPPVQLVWPECIARIEVPVPAARSDAENRRIWMLADYGNSANVLDPVVRRGGPVPSSRLYRAQWRPDRGGQVVLPRGVPGHVWMPPSIALGTRFDLIVLLINFDGQPEEIGNLFDVLERRMLVDPKETGAEPYQKLLRLVLDEAASQLDEHSVRHVLYCQKCEVVSRGTALGGARGRGP